MATQNGNEGGIFVTSKTITVIVGLVSIIGATYAGISKVNSYDYRIERLESDKQAYEASMLSLTSELKSLNNRITDLTIELRELRTKQEYAGGKK